MSVHAAKGTLLQHGVAGTPITYTTIAQRVTIDGPDMTVAEIDTTDLDSDANESMPGLPDPGTLSFTIHYDPKSTTHSLLFSLVFAPSVEPWQLVFADGTKFPFEGYLTAFKPTGAEVNGKLVAEISIRVSGVITPEYPT